MIRTRRDVVDIRKYGKTLENRTLKVTVYLVRNILNNLIPLLGSTVRDEKNCFRRRICGSK